MWEARLTSSPSTQAACTGLVSSLYSLGTFNFHKMGGNGCATYVWHNVWHMAVAQMGPRNDLVCL